MEAAQVNAEQFRIECVAHEHVPEASAPDNFVELVGRTGVDLSSLIVIHAGL